MLINRKSFLTGIYTIVNLVNGKAYVGSAVNFSARWGQHRWSLNRGTHVNKHLQSAWNKFGQGAFVFSPALYCDKEHLVLWEQIAIDGFGPNKLYNLSPTAGSPLGRKHSSETRAKMSAVKKGKKFTPEHCSNISAARKGKRFAPEHRANLSAAKSKPRKPLSTAHRAKLSAIRMGNKHNLGSRRSVETRRKMSLSQKGRTFSLEHRARLSIAQRRRFSLQRLESE